MIEARRAQELDPLSLVTSTTVANILYDGGKYDEAIEQNRKVLELDSGFRWAHHSIGEDYIEKGMFKEGIAELTLGVDPGRRNPHFVGKLAYGMARAGDRTGALKIVSDLERSDEALALSRRAVGLDPLNAGSWESLGEIEFFMGQPEEAVADLKKAIELNPDLWNGHIFLSQIYIMQGRPQDALPEIELVRYDPARAFLYPIAYYALGRKKESDAALGKLITKYHASNAYQLAEVYAFRNQSDEAFERLDRAYAQRNGGLVGANVDPLLKSLHNDPQYAAFLKKRNLSN